MRLFPPCSEGFRRLSIVLAAPILVLLGGYILGANSVTIAKGLATGGSVWVLTYITVGPLVMVLLLTYPVALFVRGIGWAVAAFKPR